MSSDTLDEGFEDRLSSSEDWVAEYGERLGQSYPPTAFRCLRVALHAIRDGLPLAEIASLAGHLPMLLRGAFYDGWRPGRVAERPATTPEALYEALARALAHGLSAPPPDVMRAVFALLEHRIAGNEILRVRALLSEPLRSMWVTSSDETPPHVAAS